MNDYSIPKEIKTKEEYEKIKLRLTEGEKLIVANGGFLKAPRAMVTKYQDLAELTLIYETENNLLPI